MAQTKLHSLQIFFRILQNSEMYYPFYIENKDLDRNCYNQPHVLAQHLLQVSSSTVISINIRYRGRSFSSFTLSEVILTLTNPCTSMKNCTARQCSPLRRKFMECSINSPALSLLVKHLVIGQRLKTPNFSAFHWSPPSSLVSIGQHFVATRVVHLPKSTETSLITESDQSGPDHQLLQLCTARTAWTRLCGPCIAVIPG